MIVSWYNNFSKEQIELLSKGFTDKYKNLQKIDSEKNTIRYVYKANNQRVQNFKMSESIPPIKRIDQDRWSGVEDIYISIRGDRSQAQTSLVKNTLWRNFNINS